MVQIKVRAIVGIMIFLGYFVLYIIRYNVSVHVLDMALWMIKKESESQGNGTNALLAAFSRSRILRLNSTRVNVSKIRSRAKLAFNNIIWDDLKISRLFSAYHIGYCVCFPIFHNIGDRYPISLHRLGPTWVVSIAGVSSGALNCLTPAAAYYDFWLLFIVRTLMGFCAGAMHPSMVQLLRHWVPPVERNHFIWAYCGLTMGTFSTFILCAAVQYYARWPLGFYITGGVQIIWAGLWTILISDCPSKHPFISRDELTYLNHTVGTIFTIRLMNAQAPWFSILRSMAFWSLCILNFGYTWLIISMSLHGPMFYTRVVEYSIHSASMLTSVSFLLRLIFGTILIHLFHWYKHNTNIQRIQYLRKYLIVVSHVAPGFLLASMWLSNVVPGPILLTSAMALTAAGMDLTLDLCYDLSPNFFISINTLIKIIGNVPGIILPLSVGQVTYWYNNTPFVWKHIWCFNGVVIMVCGLIFLFWGETRIQPWNNVIGERSRPRRPMVQIRPSVMSNIIEETEEDAMSVYRPASQQTLKKNSILGKTFSKL